MLSCTTRVVFIRTLRKFLKEIYGHGRDYFKNKKERIMHGKHEEKKGAVKIKAQKPKISISNYINS